MEKANQEEEQKHKAELEKYYQNQEVVNEFENILDDSNQLIQG